MSHFPGKFQCKNCLASLDSNSERLLDHTQFCCYMVRNSHEHKYICFSCEYCSSVRERMRKHIRKHTGARPYKCPFCLYRSTQNSALKTHMKIKHSCFWIMKATFFTWSLHNSHVCTFIYKLCTKYLKNMLKNFIQNERRKENILCFKLIIHFVVFRIYIIATSCFLYSQHNGGYTYTKDILRLPSLK